MMKRVSLIIIWICMIPLTGFMQNHSDCINAFIACSTDPIVIESLPLSGTTGEINETFCYKNAFPETNSIWIKWEIKESGKLGFTIVPLNEHDDFDFVLYKLENGMGDCDHREEIRCMASGKNAGEVNSFSDPCIGATGLRTSSNDKDEKPGCAAPDDNFLSSIDAQKGDAYALFVNNYYSSGGFVLEFTGNATLTDTQTGCNSGTVGGSVALNQSSESGLAILPVFPNPANTILNLPVRAEKKFLSAQSIIIDVQGKIVQLKNFDVEAGTQYISFDIGHLPVGVYYLKTIIGENQHITRFNKQ